MNTTQSINRSEGRLLFGQDVAGYQAGRLGYPAEVYDAIDARRGGIADRAVFEIGPGTGLATRELVRRGAARVVAIEPDPELARQLPAYVVGGDRLKVVEATFEAADLEDRWFDIGCAAASFHWLETAPALAKARAALAFGGVFAIWWNSYRNPCHNDPFAQATLPLLDGLALPPMQSANGHGSLDRVWWLSAFKDAGFCETEYHEIRRERIMSTDQIRALYASYSFVRRLASDARDRLLDAVINLAEGEFGGLVPNVVLTPLYVSNAHQQ